MRRCHSGRNWSDLVLQEKGGQYLAAFLSLAHFKDVEGLFVPFKMGIFPISAMTFPPLCRDVPGS